MATPAQTVNAISDYLQNSFDQTEVAANDAAQGLVNAETELVTGAEESGTNTFVGADEITGILATETTMDAADIALASPEILDLLALMVIA